MAASPTIPKGPQRHPGFGRLDEERLGRYTLTNAKKQKATVAVCVTCRNRRCERGREALVYAYGGGLGPASYCGVQETYRSRFAIESSYRQLPQARLRTCTRASLLRLLDVGLALVLRHVWGGGCTGSCWRCGDVGAGVWT